MDDLNTRFTSLDICGYHVDGSTPGLAGDRSCAPGASTAIGIATATVSSQESGPLHNSTHHGFERELEWASDTDSTASDLSGPGRLYDNLIGRLARPLELAINGAPRPPRPVLPSPPTMSQASFITDSEATDDDNPGPGHLVGKSISWGGRYIERFATYAVVKMGRGPYAPIESFLVILERQVRAHWPFGSDVSVCVIWDTPLPKEARTRHEALSKRLNHMTTCGYCARSWISDARVAVSTRKYLSRTLRLCSSPNITISGAALAAVTDIGASSYFAWRMLLELRADAVVRDVMQQAYGRFGCDSLLARSRTALSCVSENGLMSLLPQLNSVEELSPEAAHLMSHDLSMYFRDTDTRYLALCTVSRYSHYITIALGLGLPVEDLIIQVCDFLLDSPNGAECGIAIAYLSLVLVDPLPRSISWRYVNLQDQRTVTCTLRCMGEDYMRTIHLIPHIKRKDCAVRDAVCHVEKVHKHNECFSTDAWVSCPLRGTWRLVDNLFSGPLCSVVSKPLRFIRIA